MFSFSSLSLSVEQAHLSGCCTARLISSCNFVEMGKLYTIGTTRLLNTYFPQQLIALFYPLWSSFSWSRSMLLSLNGKKTELLKLPCMCHCSVFAILYWWAHCLRSCQCVNLTSTHSLVIAIIIMMINPQHIGENVSLYPPSSVYLLIQINKKCSHWVPFFFFLSFLTNEQNFYLCG